MNPISQILWEAAADVEERGVTRLPRHGYPESCPVYAILELTSSVKTEHSYRGLRKYDPIGEVAMVMLAQSLGLKGRASGSRASVIAAWNDAQPSRAVVAAAMRDAAFLASWAGPHLLGGSK